MRKSRQPSEQDFRAAWRLFLALQDDPTVASAESLMVWLRDEPTRVRALNEALTVWAYVGAATMCSRQAMADRLEPWQ